MKFDILKNDVVISSTNDDKIAFISYNQLALDIKTEIEQADLEKPMKTTAELRVNEEKKFIKITMEYGNL